MIDEKDVLKLLTSGPKTFAEIAMHVTPDTNRRLKTVTMHVETALNLMVKAEMINRTKDNKTGSTIYHITSRSTNHG